MSGVKYLKESSSHFFLDKELKLQIELKQVNSASLEPDVTAGIECGLSQEMAKKLVTETLVGASKLLSQSPDSASDLRKK